MLCDSVNFQEIRGSLSLHSYEYSYKRGYGTRTLPFRVQYRTVLCCTSTTRTVLYKRRFRYATDTNRWPAYIALHCGKASKRLRKASSASALFILLYRSLVEFSLNFHLPAPEATSLATSRSKLTKRGHLREAKKQVRTWTRQSGTAPGSQAATAPPELHDDLVGEDFSCLKYSGNSGNPIIRA